MTKTAKTVITVGVIFFAIVLTILGLSLNSTHTVAEAPIVTTTICTTDVSHTSNIFTTSASTSISTSGTSTSTVATTTVTKEVTKESKTELAQPPVYETEVIVEPTELPETEIVIETEPVVETSIVTEATTVEVTEPSVKTEEDYDRVAQEVWQGKWGTGADRKARLEAEGYDYSLVQQKVNELKPSQEIITEVSGGFYLSDNDRYYLAVMLSKECSPSASTAHNANAVAAMVNRVRDGWASSIYNAIQEGCVPWWSGGQLYNYGISGDSSYCYEAINYYCNNSESFGNIHSWCAAGDGVHNSYY